MSRVRRGFDGMSRLVVVALAVLVVAVGVPAIRAAAAGNAPVTGRDVERANKGQSITVSPLANDYDPEGESISILSVATPAHGTVSNQGSYFTYTPVATFSGTETITYTVRDSTGVTATGTVIVQVDSSSTGTGAPTPQQDHYATTFDHALNFTYAQLAANDTDPQASGLDTGRDRRLGRGRQGGRRGTVHVHAACGVRWDGLRSSTWWSIRMVMWGWGRSRCGCWQRGTRTSRRWRVVTWSGRTRARRSPSRRWGTTRIPRAAGSPS